ncbi:hypothetical protein LWC34_29200 [Kibdelosporangium philippinense]|uniref:Uncharacterized protein n=2 Tax=Kibdelosporangium philippinense TaxID=211113 RepID=A0ABS8ZK88_9PSEU|nr:hypothetical protein [Kibdelosporangium philippinense]MCE7006873.1 hypothetical protein [Kibdelosporangium philippinense]
MAFLKAPFVKDVRILCTETRFGQSGIRRIRVPRRHGYALRALPSGRGGDHVRTYGQN